MTTHKEIEAEITMGSLYKMHNQVQEYSWGSRSALAELLGQPVPSAAPQAELWMGAHPKSPSKIWSQGHWQNMDEAVRQDSIRILGKDVSKCFENRFPFLFKVLAVEQPLSIQAHPDTNRARDGFQRENALKIELSASDRNYRDDQHKPECICALTDFWAMSGFRKPDDIFRLLSSVWPLDQLSLLNTLQSSPEPIAIKTFFNRLMSVPKPSMQNLVEQIGSNTVSLTSHDPVFDWIIRLNHCYPGDVGVLAPTFLNLICLQPGQALFLPPGQLHAYLSGVAVEVMANSDNVLRGGLTSKHVDIQELLQILDFCARPIQVLTPAQSEDGWAYYEVGVEEFALSVGDASARTLHLGSSRGPQIILCTRGEAFINATYQSEDMILSSGQSILVTPSMREYSVTGHATLYRATVGRFTSQN